MLLLDASKAFDKITYVRLFKLLDIFENIKDKLSHNQYGAMKRLSFTHALMDWLHHLHEIIHNSNSTRICFIHYWKAFDLIDFNHNKRSASETSFY